MAKEVGVKASEIESSAHTCLYIQNILSCNGFTLDLNPFVVVFNCFCAVSDVSVSFSIVSTSFSIELYNS